MARMIAVVTLLVALARCASSDPGLGSAPPSFDGAFRVTHRGEEPALLWREDPIIPVRMRMLETEVAIDVFVNARGRVDATQFIAGDETFYPLVARAIRKWRFTPLLRDGAPASFVLPVDFALRWHQRPLTALLDISLVRDAADNSGAPLARPDNRSISN